MFAFAEAALLGLASGPACVASCGPVLAPALAARGQGFRAAAGTLGAFLSGRLAGYLTFSLVAWSLGLVAPTDAHSRALMFALVDLGMAAMLVVYALSARRCAGACKPAPLAQIQSAAGGSAALGLLTGLSLCPPFLAAGARAAEAGSLAGAATFFLIFFLGTAVWTLPLVAIGWLQRVAVAARVARIMMLLLAGWYFYLGFIALLWRFTHGR